MKLINYARQNKTVVLAWCVIALTFIFLALPGQFVRFGIINDASLYQLSGYQFIFNTKDSIVPNAGKIGSHVVGQGIAAMVMLVLAGVGVGFTRKSSFVTMVSGLVLLVTSILFYSISAAGEKAYTKYIPGQYAYHWVPYLVASLILIAAGLVIYKAVLMMKDEIKHPAKSSGPSYNYLRK